MARADDPPTPVAADELVHREIVFLKDGTIAQGVLFEKIDNDHVTLWNADGTKRVIAWAEIARVQDVQVPKPPAAGEALGDDGEVISTWPEPDRDLGAFYAFHAIVGFAGGATSLGADAGVSAEIDPVRWLGIELDVGEHTGKLFGATGGLRFRFAKMIGHHARLGLDAGYTLIGTTSVVTEVVSAWKVEFLNGGVFLDAVDRDPAHRELVRAEGGADLLANGNDFCMLTSTPMPISACPPRRRR